MMIQENIFKSNEGCVLDNFKLINPEEIINFIKSHNGLLELIEKAYPLVKNYFPNYPLSLEFYEDPESDGLDCICLYIYGNYDLFEKDFYTLNKILESDIEALNVFKPNSKRYLCIDLLYPF